LAMPIEPTWATRDLPVLETVVAYFEEHLGGLLPEVSDIAPLVGLPDEDVYRALRALDGVYLRFDLSGGPLGGAVGEVYPAARPAVGQWPSAEVWADRIVRDLAAAAEREPDEAQKSRLRAAVEAIGGAGRDVFVEVVANVISKQAGAT
jgi:hypothetical protein